MTKVLLRMEKEGTFDYKAVASNPVAAFLYLLERYIEVVPAVPPEAASLFPKIQTAILSGDVAAACSEAVVNTVTKTVAAGTIRSVARKFFTDTGATVTSIMLVIAVAIGTALGIQTVSNPVPAERQNVATTRVSQTQRTTSAESTTARPTGNNGPATNNGAATTPAPVDTVTVRTPAPAATRDNAGNTRSTTRHWWRGWRMCRRCPMERFTIPLIKPLIMSGKSFLQVTILLTLLFLFSEVIKAIHPMLSFIFRLITELERTYI